MTNKYFNSPCDLDGHHFDSRKEARRYEELLLAQKAGEIDLLEVHPRFEIIPGFKIDGKKIKATFYEADFRYWDNKIGRMVVEDVKGQDRRTGKYLITPLAALKIKLFKYLYGKDYEFRIV